MNGQVKSFPMQDPNKTNEIAFEKICQKEIGQLQYGEYAILTDGNLIALTPTATEAREKISELGLDNFFYGQITNSNSE